MLWWLHINAKVIYTLRKYEDDGNGDFENTLGSFSIDEREKERKIRRRLFTSSIKGENRHFHIVVLQWRQRNVQNSAIAGLLLLLFFLRI